MCGLREGEYVWIAESDDYADERSAREARSITRCRTNYSTCVLSIMANFSGRSDQRTLGFHQRIWIRKGGQRIFGLTGAKNVRTISSNATQSPNASAVLFRREVYVRVGGADESMVLCGDWKLWVAMALTGRIAYLGEPLNYYRFHDTSVRAKSQRLGVGPVEYLEVIRWILQRVTPSDTARRKLSEDVFSLWTPTVDALGQREPEVALRVIDEFLGLSGSECVERSVLANAWLTAAGIHYRQGRPGKAMVSAGRAVLVRPIVAGRPVKRALKRLAAALKGYLGAMRT